MSSTCIRRPRRMIATRSATASTSGRTCPEKTTVCPWALAWLTKRHDVAADGRVERRGGLVEYEQVDRVGERLRQGELLFHAGRVGADLAREVEPHHPLCQMQRPVRLPRRRGGRSCSGASCSRSCDRRAGSRPAGTRRFASPRVPVARGRGRPRRPGRPSDRSIP